MASIKVAVRVRPINKREIEHNSDCIIEMDGNKTKIFSKPNICKDQFKEFTFDYSYFSYDKNDANFASQEQVFNDLGVKVVENAYLGYNACVFAYGQTGSGKTYTMMGTSDNVGLIPRICQMLFQRMLAGKSSGISYRTEVSYMEIYNEKARDLLKPKQSHSLRIREHPKMGPYVENLSRYPVLDYSDVEELMNRGNQQRTTASTGMNDTSSRSHAIFTLNFVQAQFECDTPRETSSKVHLVDLAGSERADATGATGRRLLEGSHINKSLVTLGSVISALAEQSTKNNVKSVFIPYRDSVLTWLLKDSLGGNSQTVMIATISPACINYAESLSTLRYANRAKNIINKPTINEDANVKLIRELRDEINRLRSRIGGEHIGVESPQIQQELRDKEFQEKLLIREWTDKWKETASILQEQHALGLRKAPLGQGVTLDSEKPHLLGIDDDLYSTGITLYDLKEGVTTIGSGNNDDFVPDIVLNKEQISPRHCEIVMVDNEAVLIPYPGSVCWVNSSKVDDRTELTQGCLIVLGETSMFRYNNPAEAQRLKKQGYRKSLSRMSFMTRSITDLMRAPEMSSASVNTMPSYPNKLDSQADYQVGVDLRRMSEAIKNLLEDNYCNTQGKFQDLDSKLDNFVADKQGILRAIEQSFKSRGEESDSYLSEEYRSFKSLLKKVYDEASQCCGMKKEAAVSVGDIDRLVQEEKDQEEIVRDHAVKVKELSSSMAGKIVSLEDRILQQLGPSQLTSENKRLCIDILGEKNYEIEDSINFLVDIEKDRILMILDDLGDQKLDVEADLQEVKRSLDVKYIDPEEKVRLQGRLDGLENKKRCLEEEENIAEEDFERKLEGLNKVQELLMDCRPLLSIKADELSQLEVALAAQQADLERSQGKLDLLREQIVDSRQNYSSLPVRPASDRWRVIADMLASQIDLSERPPTVTEGVESSPSRSGDTGSRRPALQPKDRLRSPRGLGDSFEDDVLDVRRNVPTIVLSEVQIESGSDNNTPGSGFEAIPEDLEGQISALNKIHDKLNQLVSDQNEQGGCDDLSESYTWEETEVAEDRLSLLIEQEVQRRLFEERIYREEQLRTERDVERKERQREIKQLHAQYQRELESLKEQIDLKQSNLQIIDLLSSALSHSAVSGSSVQNVARDTSSQGHHCPSKYIVRIPSYCVRGSGYDSHYEYEVKIVAGKDAWSIYRRFTRFRELHQTLVKKYGEPISRLHMPSRKLLSWNQERLVEERKGQLEVYMNELLETCRHLEESPLYPFRDQPNKIALIELSPFFKRGHFETTKHGTC